MNKVKRLHCFLKAASNLKSFTGNKFNISLKAAVTVSGLPEAVVIAELQRTNFIYLEATASIVEKGVGIIKENLIKKIEAKVLNRVTIEQLEDAYERGYTVLCNDGCVKGFIDENIEARVIA